MKFAEDRPFAKPEAAGALLLELARTADPNPHNRIYTGKINYRFTDRGGSFAEYRAGIEWLVANGLIEMHGSGTFFHVKTPAGQE